MIESIKNRWSDILLAVKEDNNLPEVSYKTWLTPLSPDSLNGNILTVVYDGERQGIVFIEKKYKYLIRMAIEFVTGVKCDINFIVPEDKDTSSEKKSVFDDTSKKYQTINNVKLNSKYTFNSFVVGNSNKFAQAASLAVAESPGEIYNPLFIYGGVGLGKTHLMNAISLFILQRNPEARVMYTTCESFTNDLVESIRNKNKIDLREKYRNVDVLLIDDIQLIQKGEFIQEEIFNTFNYLYESNKQIVFASDRPPKEINNIDERISSRFLSGLTVDITVPDYETRVAILKKKEEIEGYNIDNEVINYIASNIKTNNRELCSALIKVVALSKLDNKEVTVELAQVALKDHFSSDDDKEITLERIRDVVAEHYGIKVSDLASEKRCKEIAYPRQVAMYLCCELTTFPLMNIARVLGKKDHSTVIHGREKIASDIESDDVLKQTIDILKKKLST